MILPAKIEAYLNENAPPVHPLMEEMHRIAEERNFPIIGPLVGRMLVSLIRFGHVHTILECGAGYGYAALWMAMALPENGRITCVEYSEENVRTASSFFERAALSHKVNFIIGDVHEVVPTLRQSFDMIVNDIDKDGYPAILPHLLKRLRTGGMLVTDNILWQGKVTRKAADRETAAIQQYTRSLMEHRGLWTTIIPLRDGVSLSVKLQQAGQPAP